MHEDPQARVAAGYDAAIDRYAALEDASAAWPRLRWLDALLACVPDGGHVLDLGCAAGVPVAARIAEGHRVTGVDISPAQIERARLDVPAGRFVCADAAALELAPATLDAVVSLYTFDHIPRQQHAALLARVHRWLRPGGHLLLSVEDADRPGDLAEWLAVEMYFSSFDADTTRGLVAEAGFELLATDVAHQHEGDVEVPYVWVLARKPAARTG